MRHLSQGLLAFVAASAACATSPSSTSTSSTSSGPELAVAPVLTMRPPTPDPRVGLRAGWMNAGEASWNLRRISTTPPSEKFLPAAPGDQRFWNSDLAFTRNYVIQGIFSGFQVWDVSNAARPTLATAYVCPGSQSDVSVYRNLLFVSHESGSARLDCGIQGVPDAVSRERARGIRVYDITDMRNPKMLTVVQTCRGSHTHTLVDDPKDRENVYIYVSGSAGVRSAEELAGCTDVDPSVNPNTSRFRIEVIQVPLANPAQARIVSSGRIFAGLAQQPGNISRDGPPQGGRGSAAAANAVTAPGPQRAMGPDQCHDITVYPGIGLAGGACGGYGLLIDISDVKNPRRIGAVADSNFSYWHSATFNNDGTKVLFTDEWGGGTGARCRTTDRPEWGANAIFTIDRNREMSFRSYYKLPAPQTSSENCVAHNGSLIPIPGRDVMAQGWYQGGISIFDWTNPSNPVEIAYHDRGPINADTLKVGGSWSIYWYNGRMYSSEMARGLDIFELQPSDAITQNELDAANSVRFDYLNAQNQPRLVWPASFALSKAYVDQLARSNGLSASRIASVRSEIAAAEQQSGQGRRDALTRLAGALTSEVGASADKGKLRMLVASLRDLAR